jgi:hypothetical protein
MARNLLDWSRYRMPIASFLQYVQSNSNTADEKERLRKLEEKEFEDSQQTNKQCDVVASLERASNLHSMGTEARAHAAKNTHLAGRVERVSDLHSMGAEARAHAAKDARLAERVICRVVTHNVNSIIAAIGRHEGRLLEFIERNRADVIALQETMVDPQRPLKGEKWKLLPFIRRVRKLGYHVYWHPGTRSSGDMEVPCSSHYTSQNMSSREQATTQSTARDDLWH